MDPTPGASSPRHPDASPPSPPQANPDPDPDPRQADDNPPASPTGNSNASSSPQHVPASSPPPFWASPSTHSRSLSYQSVSLHRPSGGGPIQLEDHSEEDHVQAQSCWAESASVDEHVVVSGVTGVGAYVVWHCTVKTLKGGDLEIRKRYSEFDALRYNLVRSFPHAEAMIPELPRKSVVSRFRPKFLEARKRGLNHFLNCILLNPEFASSPVLKDFVFS